MLSSSESFSQQDTYIPSFTGFLVKYAKNLTISDKHLSCVTVLWLAPPGSSHVYEPYRAWVVLTSARNTPLQALLPSENRPCDAHLLYHYKLSTQDHKASVREVLS